MKTDYINIYHYIHKNLEKNPENADKYKRLFDRGYLVQTENSEYVNITIIKKTYSELVDALPDVPTEIIQTIENFSDEFAGIMKNQIPAQLHEPCYQNWYKFVALNQIRPIVLKLLVEKGLLREVNDIQKKTLNLLLFCDKLPE
jgi:hypothetical protein